MVMWCILCCQAQTREDIKCPEQETARPLELHKTASSERVALISPINSVNMDASHESPTTGPDHECNDHHMGDTIIGINGNDAVKSNLENNYLVKHADSKVNPLTEKSTDISKSTNPTTATVPRLTTSLAPSTPETAPSTRAKLVTTSLVEPTTTATASEQISKRSQKTHRAEGMSVSFNTPEETSKADRPPGQHSVTGRPIWTLKDVLDSPYKYEPTTDGKPDELIISVSDSKPYQTETKCVDSTEQSVSDISTSKPNNDGGNNNGGRVQLSRRHTRPGSLYHPHTTFFLPRISTDPTTGHHALDHAYAMDGKLLPIRRGSMIVRSGRTTASSTNVQSSAIEQTTTGAPSAGVEGFIVTPFAQVLVSMQRIRSAFIRLTATQSTNR
ncbi:unnamed protein product [Echinostoma caproni]|uniref:PDE4_UCR domain-containing protein n=1 Tax=Echinostoma caproni TaxID=27848 RepID=A0A183A5D4_9TREM|nr:unnamed protein product [Echinostoma caproni]